MQICASHSWTSSVANVRTYHESSLLSTSRELKGLPEKSVKVQVVLQVFDASAEARWRFSPSRSLLARPLQPAGHLVVSKFEVGASPSVVLRSAKKMRCPLGLLSAIGQGPASCTIGAQTYQASW